MFKIAKSLNIAPSLLILTLIYCFQVSSITKAQTLSVAGHNFLGNNNFGFHEDGNNHFLWEDRVLWKRSLFGV